MADKNTTFRFKDFELELLDKLSKEMGCSKTQVIRTALNLLRDHRGDLWASLQAFIDQLNATYGDEAVLVFELDDSFDPFVTVDGQRQDDIYTPGQVVEMVERDGLPPWSDDEETGKSEDFVKVFIGDARSDVRILIGLFPMRSGVRVAVPLRELTPDMRPRAVTYFPGE